ncbi:MAG TPA: 2-dehydropantoate 2-reductase [Allosphingosinicella sp.]|uniref:2-dehydropantoate 2-reductase n=1 Tax=Allosphingosinicella sp. TaxID=2823234 RepID=UPI002F2AB11E
MHVVILGAGSVGCFIGGAWQAAGLSVSFIGRERVRDEVARHGLMLSDHEGWRVRLAHDLVDFSTKPAALAKADVIALCVKSSDTEAAARQISAHAKRKPVVISFQNGIDNVERLSAALPSLEIIQGMVPFNIAHLGDGRWHKGTSGELAAGRSQATEAIAARAKSGPARLRLADDMVGLAWGKLLINLNNAVNALSGETLLDQLSKRDYRRVVAASMVETLDLLAAAGIEPAQVGPLSPKLLPHAIAAPDFIFKNLLLRVQKIDPQARSSMADDLAAGRTTEVDYLNGEVVRLAERLGRNAPVNRTIVNLIKQREAGVEQLWSPDQLRKYVMEGHRGVAIFGY